MINKTEVNLAVKGKIQSNKDIIFLVLSLLISAASLCFLTAPAYSGLLSVQEENAEKEKDLQNKQELLADVKTFNKENKSTSVDSKKLGSFISNRNNYEDYFFHLEELSRQSNLEVVSMELQAGNNDASSANNANAGGAAVMTDGEEGSANSQPENGGSLLKEQYINLSVRGSFDNMMYFYKILENGIPFLQEVSTEVAYDKQTSEINGSLTEQEQNPNPILESKMILKFNYY